ncbi:MAG: serine protease [Pseudomonadota bacterium]
MLESLLVAITRVATWSDKQLLTHATGFFFERDKHLFLITNRHVVLDEANQHHPDRLEIELHTNPENVAITTQFSLPLYGSKQQPLWKEASDAAGLIDVVAIKINRENLPQNLFIAAFTPAHLLKDLDQIEIGTSVLILGFPLGFHDTLHHLPIARQAVIASAFGMRFQGNGYFLTDARTHRGSSGTPVVARLTEDVSSRGHLPWILLGIHSARLDVPRDTEQDERLNLNCAWYADVLMVLTEPAPAKKMPTIKKSAPLPITNHL